MKKSRDDRLPFEIETGREGSTSAGRASSRSGNPDGGTPDHKPRTGRSCSALVLGIALIGVFGYVALRQLGGGPPPVEAEQAFGDPAWRESGQELVPAEPDASAEDSTRMAGEGETAGARGEADDLEPLPPPPSRRRVSAGPEGAEAAMIAARAGSFARAAEIWSRTLASRSDGTTHTIQLSANCETDHLRPLFGRSADPRLFLLPVTLQGRPCYRTCYGRYASAGDAERAARALPTGLTRGGVARVVVLDELIQR